MSTPPITGGAGPAGWKLAVILSGALITTAAVALPGGFAAPVQALNTYPALAAAVTIAFQLGLTHWFYLYIPWFFGLVILALFGALTDPSGQPPAAASAPARSSQPAAALSS